MRLVLVIAFVISGFVALSMAFFQKTRKTYPGFGLWTAGVGLVSLGYLFYCLRGYIPEAISIFGVNAAFPLGMLLHLAGMRRFLELTPMPRLWYALPGATVILSAVFYYGYDSLGLRTLIVSIAVAAIHFALAFLIFSKPLRPRSMFYGVIGYLLALAGVITLGRGIWSFADSQFQVLAGSPVHLIFFVSVVVLQLGEDLAFIMLNSQRLESELMEAEAGLKLKIGELQQALAEVKTLSGLLPICFNCKKIRDDQGYWQAVEHFIREHHSQVEFSHGICPECLQKLYPEFADKILSDKA